MPLEPHGFLHQSMRIWLLFPVKYLWKQRSKPESFVNTHSSDSSKSLVLVTPVALHHESSRLKDSKIGIIQTQTKNPIFDCSSFTSFSTWISEIHCHKLNMSPTEICLSVNRLYETYLTSIDKYVYVPSVVIIMGQFKWKHGKFRKYW